MVVITDENHKVVEVAFIPGNNMRLPVGWHSYFPITEKIPPVGEQFIPDLKKQPWLDPNYA